MSKQEDYIAKLLKNSNIIFIREKSFSDLKNGSFRFDFYLPEFNCCIEYDGQQHFYQVKAFQKIRRDFLKQQEHDRLKNSYCLSRGIKLYRIPYWELKNIKNFSDIIVNKFRVTTKWWNDILWDNYSFKSNDGLVALKK